MKRLSIRTKDLSIARVSPNWAQQEFLDTIERQSREGVPQRVIVLKARQLGMSTITGAVLFARSFVYPQSHSLVVAHENDASEYLFGMTHLFWETFPYKELYRPRYVSRREMSWYETGSSIRIATARNARAGRGRTIHALHGSEVAFWDQPEELMLGMRQTIPNKPGTLIVLESTANGVGNWFYDQWQAAVAGETEYVPLFFPWWKHPEYTASYCGLDARVREYDSEELLLKRLGCDDDHLGWRRWAIRNLADNNEERFHQEYPATPDEAFLATGTNVFPVQSLKKCYEPLPGIRGFLVRDGSRVKFQADRAGSMTMYRQPSADRDWGRYFVGGDPTHVTMGDNACAQVINRRTYEQVAVWHGKIDPMGFAEELAKLGKFYNDATLATEVTGPGYATIGRLVELDYPHLWRGRWADKNPGRIAESMGWSSSMKSKEWAIGWLLKLVVDQDLILHDRRTYEEMNNYITLPNGGYGNAGGANYHDDTVMALAISCLCSSTEGPVVAYSGQQGGNDFREPIPAWEQWGSA